MAKRQETDYRRSTTDFSRAEKTRSDKAFYDQLNQMGLERPAEQYQTADPRLDRSRVGLGETTFGQSANLIGGDNVFSGLANILDAGLQATKTGFEAALTYGQIHDDNVSEDLQDIINDIESNTELTPPEKTERKASRFKEYENKFFLKTNKNQIGQLAVDSELQIQPERFNWLESGFKTELDNIEATDWVNVADKYRAIANLRERASKSYAAFSDNRQLNRASEESLAKIGAKLTALGDVIQNEDLRKLQLGLSQTRLELNELEGDDNYTPEEIQVRKESMLNQVTLFRKEHGENLSELELMALTNLELETEAWTRQNTDQYKSERIGVIRTHLKKKMNNIRLLDKDPVKQEEAAVEAMEYVTSMVEKLDLNSREEEALLVDVVGPLSQLQYASSIANAANLLGDIDARWPLDRAEFFDWLYTNEENIDFDFENDAVIFDLYEEWVTTVKGIPLYTTGVMPEDEDKDTSTPARDYLTRELVERGRIMGESLRKSHNVAIQDRAITDLNNMVDGFITKANNVSSGMTDRDMYQELAPVLGNITMVYRAYSNNNNVDVGLSKIASKLDKIIPAMVHKDMDVYPDDQNFTEASYNAHKDAIRIHFKEEGIPDYHIDIIMDKMSKAPDLFPNADTTSLGRPSQYLNFTEHDEKTDTTTFSVPNAERNIRRYGDLPQTGKREVAPLIINDLTMALGSVVQRVMENHEFSIPNILGDHVTSDDRSKLLRGFDGWFANLLEEVGQVDGIEMLNKASIVEDFQAALPRFAEESVGLNTETGQPKIRFNQQQIQKMGLRLAEMLEDDSLRSLLEIREDVRLSALGEVSFDVEENISTLGNLQEYTRNNPNQYDTMESSGGVTIGLTKPRSPEEETVVLIQNETAFENGIQDMLGIERLQFDSPSDIRTILPKIFETLLLGDKGEYEEYIAAVKDGNKDAKPPISFFTLLQATPNISSHDRKNRVKALLRSILPANTLSGVDLEMLAGNLTDRAATISPENYTTTIRDLTEIVTQNWLVNNVTGSIRDRFVSVNNMPTVWDRLDLDWKRLDTVLSTSTERGYPFDTLVSLFGEEGATTLTELLMRQTRGGGDFTVMDLKNTIDALGMKIEVKDLETVAADGQVKDVKKYSFVLKDPNRFADKTVFTFGEDIYKQQRVFQDPVMKEPEWVEGYLDDLRYQGADDVGIAAMNLILTVPERIATLATQPALEGATSNYFQDLLFDYQVYRDSPYKDSKPIPETLERLARFMSGNDDPQPEHYLAAKLAGSFIDHSQGLSVQSFALMQQFITEGGQEGTGLNLDTTLFGMDLDPVLRNGGVSFDIRENIEGTPRITQLDYVFEGDLNSGHPARPSERINGLRWSKKLWNALYGHKPAREEMETLIPGQTVFVDRTPRPTGGDASSLWQWAFKLTADPDQPRGPLGQPRGATSFIARLPDRLVGISGERNPDSPKIYVDPRWVHYYGMGHYRDPSWPDRVFGTSRSRRGPMTTLYTRDGDILFDGYDNPNPQTPFPTKHPMVENEDGTFSNIKTATVEMDGKHYVIPTMVDGEQLDINTAIEVAESHGMENYPSYKTAEEAEEESRKLSAQQRK